jgi:sugar phosphate isomerase/epimerase
MNRRFFLLSATATMAAPSWASSEFIANAAKLDRISIMTYNFGNVLTVPGSLEKSNHTLDVLDLPQMFADRYGIHHIEFQGNHLPVADNSLMQELLGRIKKAKSRISQINVETNGMSISSPETEKRDAAIAACRQWVDHAAVFGCPRVMINQGRLTSALKEQTIRTLKETNDYAKSKGIKLTMEDRARSAPIRNSERGQVVYPPAVLPPSPSWVVDDSTMAAWKNGFPFVMPTDYVAAPLPTWIAPDGENLLMVEHAEATGIFINIDLGGIGAETQEDINTRIRQLMPFTSGQVHINWRDNPGWDLPSTIRYIRDLGFKGMYVIEARPTGDSYAITNGLREVILKNI